MKPTQAPTVPTCRAYWMKDGTHHHCALPAMHPAPSCRCECGRECRTARTEQLPRLDEQQQRTPTASA